MAKTSISLWDAKTLLIILAGAQSATLVYCFVVMDGHDQESVIFWLSLVRGLAAGIGISFSASYAAYQAPRIQKAIAQKMAYVSLGILILSELVFVSILTNGTPAGEWRIAASVAVAALLSAAAVAVAACGGRLFAQETAGATAQPAEKKDKRKKEEQVFACRYSGQGCKETRPTQNAINAHAGKCQYRPVAVDKSLLINKQ